MGKLNDGLIENTPLRKRNQYYVIQIQDKSKVWS